jgi:SAM-dependent methyltransferase
LFVLRRGEYGYDAPWFPMLFGFLSMAAGLGATISWRQGAIRPAMRMTLYFVFFVANTSSFLYTTRRGKFLEWDRILDRLHLRGDEGVLDMGCGRGAVLTAVARRLTTGRVTGVDIWSKTDQSGNASEVTLRNASLEGVAGRVQIETGDMRALPHPDATFDLVVSRERGSAALSKKARRSESVALSDDELLRCRKSEQSALNAVVSHVSGAGAGRDAPRAGLSRKSAQQMRLPVVL